MTDSANRQNSSPSGAEAHRSMVLLVGNGVLQACVGREEGAPEMVVDRHWSAEPADSLARLEDVVYEHPLLFDDVKSVVLLHPSMTTLAPSALIQDSEIESVDAVMDKYDLSEDKECFAETIGDADDNQLLYSMPRGMYGFLERCFPTEHIHHSLNPFLNCFLPSASAARGDAMWVDLHGDSADVAAFRDGRLLLANTWNYRSETDIVYYLVMVWRTLGMDADSGHLYLSGPAKARSNVTAMLRKYINYVAMPSVARELKDSVAAGIPLSMAVALRGMRE